MPASKRGESSTSRSETVCHGDKAPWFLYLIRCRDGSLYTGISTNVERRFDAHSRNRGARRLRGRGPLELVYFRKLGDRTSALQMEHRVKRLSKCDKEKIICGELDLPA